MSILSVRFRWLLISMGFFPFVNCEGRSTTDTLPWGCNESCDRCPAPLEPAGIQAFWRFDDEELQARFVGSEELHWVRCNDRGGGEWVVGNGWSQVCGSERLGGMGGSLRLSGQGYLSASPEIDEQGPVTLAAWVSVLRSSTQRMTVASLVREGCRSAWLDLATDDWRHRLVLSVERSIEDSEECEVTEWVANLPSGIFDWGHGNWYHVAAVVDEGDEHSLFVDGLVSPDTEAEHYTVPAALEAAVHIGADPTGNSKFSGLIDDVAIFSGALEGDALREFVEKSNSVRSDGQYWTTWSADRSTVSWQVDCRETGQDQSQEGAAVVIDNGYWSAGGMHARVDTGQRINRLKKVTLVADVPDGESFDFVLASPHNAERCTWHASGKGKQRYEFSLDELNHCDCPSGCDCSFEVKEARVGSRWDEDGELALSVCRVEFEWEELEENPLIDLALGPGGMQGLKGWCWRPISYHETAFVQLDQEHTSLKGTVGALWGSNRETAYLAADFAYGSPGKARELCDLSEVTSIKLTAVMPEGFSYQFRLADYTGIGREWSRLWHQDQATQEFDLCTSQEADPSSTDCGRDLDPIPHRLRSVDLSRIRHLGIQKSFELTTEEGTVAIQDVQFEGTVRGNCAVSIDINGEGDPQ